MSGFERHTPIAGPLLLVAGAVLAMANESVGTRDPAGRLVTGNLRASSMPVDAKAHEDVRALEPAEGRAG